ncbi:hypothetical protein [Bosea sp. 685]|uniref:hypothetical protein n=1 Tax=Bosea sp. 685 TaxID=3080057 RepID=UPI00289299BC|nr:hypothetical protein [Bosea sp. 685]WNJ93218.1 hypothetical protein RMR04_13395 [Bosea sp. 685]
MSPVPIYGCRRHLRLWFKAMNASQPIQPMAGSPSLAAEAWRMRLIFSLLSAAIVATVLLVRAPALLQDPDSWWHIRVGLDMLATRTFPTFDSYSHSFAGQPWIAKEWLSQVLLALAYKSAGWNGVALVITAAISLMVFLLAWQLGETLKPTTAIALAVSLALLSAPVFTARPHVFTLPIIVVWTASLFRAAGAGRPPSFGLLGLLWLWTNLHASFTLGFVIAAFAGLDILIRYQLARPRLLAQWCIFGALCPLVSLVNPYGLKAILATFAVAGANEAVPLIMEWQPFNASANPLSEAALLLMLLGLLLSGLRFGLARALFALFALHLYLTHERFVYVFFLLVPLVLAAPVAEQFPALSIRTWMMEQRDGLERFLLGQYRRALAASVALAIGVGVILVGGAAVEPGQKTSAKDALAFAAQHNLSGPVFNSYDFGGTLIFHGIKTFIDGRTDQLFLNGFTQANDATGRSTGKPLLETQLRKYGIDWALLSAGDSRIPFFDELPGWTRAYSDRYAMIYTRSR